MAQQTVSGAGRGRASRWAAWLLLPLLVSACATQPPAPPPPPGYWYPPYGYYDVPAWDPYVDPWFAYDGFGCYGCGYGYYPGYAYGPAYYGIYRGGGYHRGWGHRPGPGWPRPPWGGSRPFPRPVVPGAAGGLRPHAVAPHPMHSFPHSRR